MPGVLGHPFPVRGVARLLGVLTLVIAGLAIPAAATAGPPGWTAPIAVSADGEDLFGDGRVVIDEDGTATYVWIAREGNGSVVRAARCTATSCAAPVDVSQTGLQIREVAVAVAADGAVVVAWVQRLNLQDALHARVYREGAWGLSGSVYDVAGSNPFDIQVALFDGALAVYSFRAFDGGVSRANAWQCVGYNVLCAATTVTSTGSVSDMRLASNGKDAGVLVYTQLVGLDRETLSTSLRRLADGSMQVGNAVPIASTTSEFRRDLAVVVDSAGVVSAGWAESSALNPIYVQRYPFDQPPGANAVLPADVSADQVRFASLVAGVDRDGTVTFVWGVVPAAGGADQIVRSLTYVDGTSQGMRQVMPAAQGGTQSPALAASAGGRVVTAVDAGNRVRTKIRSEAAGSWANRFTRRQAGGASFADMRLAANASGRTALLWRATVGGADRYYASQLGPDVTVTATRPRLRRNAITTRVRASESGRVVQVGRYKKGRRNVLACRTRVVRVTANRTRTARCVLTGVALRDRRAGRRPRITITTTLRPSSGQRVRTTTTYRLPRRR